jgi:hypothetical protein
MNEYKELVEWHKRGENDVLGEKHVQVPVTPPQIPHMHWPGIEPEAAQWEANDTTAQPVDFAGFVRVIFHPPPKEKVLKVDANVAHYSLHLAVHHTRLIFLHVHAQWLNEQFKQVLTSSLLWTCSDVINNQYFVVKW